MSPGDPAPSGARTDPRDLPAIPATPPAGDLARPGAADLIAMFFAGMRERTRRAYAYDLAMFAKYVGAADASAAVELLTRSTHGEANALALGWRGHLMASGKAPATVARRLAALASVVKLARTIGRIPWTLETAPPKVEAYRDTRGPGADGYAKMVKAAELAGDGPAARRDMAILRILHDRALRRGELVRLDLADYDPAGPALAVVGKGRDHRERLRIGKGTAAALDRWIQARGPHPGPLFCRADRKPIGPASGRLSDESVRRIIARIADAGRVEGGCRPHGLRHQGITAAMDSGRDVRDVQRFSRHKDIKTLMIYDDNRKDIGGDIADALGQ